ncbi:hypothetical protein Anas_08310 [Armadillidium nasatum]|uniref:Uncharacterized protein n=1 Tax=Armadillidium nasatum TaxID=96803 RepID=A0A5N5SIY5_9CRUS|nr:hypothetical protein Anas_08310 [Armadillidium nasatum]
MLISSDVGETSNRRLKKKKSQGLLVELSQTKGPDAESYSGYYLVGCLNITIVFDTVKLDTL